MGVRQTEEDMGSSVDEGDVRNEAQRKASICEERESGLFQEPKDFGYG